MSTIVTRIDLDPETAEAVKIAVGLVRDKVIRDLADTPPVHTRRALEEQEDRLASALRAIDLGLANPVEVPLPDAEAAS